MLFFIILWLFVIVGLYFLPMSTFLFCYWQMLLPIFMLYIIIGPLVVFVADVIAIVVLALFLADGVAMC